MEHKSVLLKECIDALDIKPDGIYVDGTLGRGGHSLEILKRLTTGHLYCFDIDQQAIDESKEYLKAYSESFSVIKANFAEMYQKLAELNVTSVDGILLDIGVSSPQFDDPQRGFSYRFDSRLDMRMDQTQSLDAYKIVNEYSFNDLYYIIAKYGQEPYAKQIARNIEAKRKVAPIQTTGQLVEVIKEALPNKVKSKPGHPAKQTFQALRIAVNHELDSLEKGIDAGIKLLNHQGRFAIISFHSLEDEIVKHKFVSMTKIADVDKRIAIKQKDLPISEYELVNKKAILATDEELDENHRSHSAKLRVLKRR